jgi:hypothetical protein
MWRKPYSLRRYELNKYFNQIFALGENTSGWPLSFHINDETSSIFLAALMSLCHSVLQF